MHQQVTKMTGLDPEFVNMRSRGREARLGLQLSKLSDILRSVPRFQEQRQRIPILATLSHRLSYGHGRRRRGLEGGCPLNGSYYDVNKLWDRGEGARARSPRERQAAVAADPKLMF